MADEGYDYPSSAPPSGMEVLHACEVLMRAGYTIEALLVLQAALPHAREAKALVRKMQGHRLVRKGEVR